MGCTPAGMTLPRTSSFPLYLVTLKALDRGPSVDPEQGEGRRGELTVLLFTALQGPSFLRED